MKPVKVAPGVFSKGRWYYLVIAIGKKRKWIKLTRISEGLPAVYTALAKAKAELSGPRNVPALIAQWERDVMPRHAEKTQRDDRARGRVIAEAFVEFRADQVDAPDCSDFLAQFASKPRTFNAYRAQLRELMRFAEERGLRHAGTNPIQAIRTMSTPARDRYITDSELRRIKVAAMRDGRRKGEREAGDETRSGPMLCALIDMAYLTGQAIGDLLALEWSQMGDAGITFARAKVEHSTKSKVLIEWTPKLRDVERRLRAMRKERRAFGSRVFVSQSGQPYTYSGVASAWRRAREHSGVRDCTIHDIKAKAVTDTDLLLGREAARRKGQHSTEKQTATYIRHRLPQKARATK